MSMFGVDSRVWFTQPQNCVDPQEGVLKVPDEEARKRAEAEVEKSAAAEVEASHDAASVALVEAEANLATTGTQGEPARRLLSALVCLGSHFAQPSEIWRMNLPNLANWNP